MNILVTRIDTGIGVSFIASAVIHMAVFLLIAWSGGLFPQREPIQETYYVDVVTLPTSNPQSGTPAQVPREAEIAAPAPPPPSSSKSPAVLAAKSARQAASQTSESDAAFAERMAKLESKNEARREEDVFKKLASKVKTGRSGMPNAGGVEAGSRYSDYVKSRLEDALKLTSSYSTNKPEVAVRLTISPEGKLVRVKIERSSGDTTFELAVRRAIDLASEKFTAPPNRSVFENGFIFKKGSISNSPSR